MQTAKTDSEYNEKIKNFNSWKEIQFPKLVQLFNKNFKKIEESEASIIKRVNQIKISREKISNNWLHNIQKYLEELEF